MHTCIPRHGHKRSLHSFPSWVNAGNNNTPSMHHPQWQNVMTSMIELKKKKKKKVTYVKISPKLVNPRDIAEGIQKKKTEGPNWSEEPQLSLTFCMMTFVVDDSDFSKRCFNLAHVWMFMNWLTNVAYYYYQFQILYIIVNVSTRFCILLLLLVPHSVYIVIITIRISTRFWSCIPVLPLMTYSFIDGHVAMSRTKCLHSSSCTHLDLSGLNSVRYLDTEFCALFRHWILCIIWTLNSVCCLDMWILEPACLSVSLNFFDLYEIELWHQSCVCCTGFTHSCMGGRLP